MVTTTRLLDVPGARLHHEIRGTGDPVLLLIHGGASDAGFLDRFADALAAHVTVVSYDRRGFGRSPLTAPADDDRHIQVNADDAAALVRALDRGAAHVFASSSGAVIGLDLLSRHPDVVRTLVAHEPPAIRLLPDAAERLAFHERILTTYRTDGRAAAIALHVSSIGLSAPDVPPGVPLPPQLAAMIERLPANQEFWLAHEVRATIDYQVDVEALRGLRDRLVLAGGADSHDHYPYWSGRVLAADLGSTVHDFPGDHVGYVRHPAECAERLIEVLDAGR